jgi:hypothetical protein
MSELHRLLAASDVRKRHLNLYLQVGAAWRTSGATVLCWH